VVIMIFLLVNDSLLKTGEGFFPVGHSQPFLFNIPCL
jgi:hypothetical protein